MTNDKEWLEVLKLAVEQQSSEGPDPYPPIAAWDRITCDSSVRRAWKEALDAASFELYVHIPFCNSICSFCNVEIRRIASRSERERYIESLESEIAIYSRLRLTGKVRYVFIGGGTPNLLEASQIRRLLTCLRTRLPVQASAEVVMEVSPEYLDDERITAMRDTGVSVLSIGSGRTQKASAVKPAYFRCRKAGFDRIIIDILAGLPWQSENGFLKNLRQVASWRPDEICMETFSPENTAFSRSGRVLSDPQRSQSEISIRRGFELLRSLGYHHRANESFSSLKKGEQGCRTYRSLFDRRSVLGLGLGSLSHIWGRYWTRNTVSERAYSGSVKAGRLPLAVGRAVTPRHEKISYILNSLGRGWVSGSEYESIFREPIEKMFGRQFLELSAKRLVSRRGKSYCVRRPERAEYDCARPFYDKSVIHSILKNGGSPPSRNIGKRQSCAKSQGMTMKI